jgi:hypothetical protein
MGLKLEYSLFHGVDPDSVWGQLQRLLGNRIQPVAPRDEPYQTIVHERDGDWAMITPGYGWESGQTREVHRQVTGSLSCTSLFVAVWDGEYWCYELWREGRLLGRFRQDPSPEIDYFPDDPAEGNPEILAAQLPWLSAADVAPYLVKLPDHRNFETGNERLDREAYLGEVKRLNVRARPGDEFKRFSECAVVDFLRLLGVGVDPDRAPFGTVELAAPARHRFFLAPSW